MHARLIEINPEYEDSKNVLGQNSRCSRNNIVDIFCILRAGEKAWIRSTKKKNIPCAVVGDWMASNPTLVLCMSLQFRLYFRSGATYGAYISQTNVELFPLGYLLRKYGVYSNRNFYLPKQNLGCDFNRGLRGPVLIGAVRCGVAAPRCCIGCDENRWWDISGGLRQIWDGGWRFGVFCVHYFALLLWFFSCFSLCEVIMDGLASCKFDGVLGMGKFVGEAKSM